MNADHFHIRRVPTPSTIACSIPRYSIILAELMEAGFRSRSYRAPAHAGGLFVAAAAGADRPATKRSGWKLRLSERTRLCLATRNSCYGQRRDPACLDCGTLMMVAEHEVREAKPDFMTFRCKKCGRSEKFVCDMRLYRPTGSCRPSFLAGVSANNTDTVVPIRMSSRSGTAADHSRSSTLFRFYNAYSERRGSGDTMCCTRIVDES